MISFTYGEFAGLLLVMVGSWLAAFAAGRTYERMDHRP